MNRYQAPSYSVSIYVAGDVAEARRTCRRFCFEAGLCVTVEEVSFIYTGGEETGVRVGLINYPRFPVDPIKIDEKASLLALRLMEDLSQWSVAIVGPDETVWLSRRPAA